MKALFTIIVWLFLLQFSMAQKAHYFVDYEDVLSSNPSEYYGRMQLRGNKNLKSEPFYTTQTAWIDSIAHQFSNLPKANQNVLIYIHGLWADHDAFFEKVEYELHRDIFQYINKPYGLILSFQWEGLIDYDKNVDIARQSGVFYSDVLSKITDTLSCINPSIKTSLYCHSMGNRVLNQMIATLHSKQLLESSNFDKIFMMAPDLPHDALTSVHMNQLSDNAKEIHVYHHYEDKTLEMASRFQHGQRLGITGPSDLDSLHENIIVKNITSYEDFQSFPGRIGHHRYFHDSPRVKNEVKTALINCD